MSHLWFALFFGGVICSLPMWLAPQAPRRAQHPAGDRHEPGTFLRLCWSTSPAAGSKRTSTISAPWRCWPRIATGACSVPFTIIVAVDHFARGVWWPESVFGVATASPYRWLEHAFWLRGGRRVPVAFDPHERHRDAHTCPPHDPHRNALAGIEPRQGTSPRRPTAPRASSSPT